MQINELDLTSFRNYQRESFIFDPYINIFIGDNAQGKTNILEAIYFLSSSRSFRTRKLLEMIRFEDHFASVQGNILSARRKYDMRIVITKEGKKAFINKKVIDKTSDYIGYLNTILFLPEDLLLIKGSPSGRRQLLDQELSKISPIYMFNINKYHKILKERNAYLKVLKDQRKDADLYLEVLSEQLATLSADIIKKRIAFTKQLDQYSRSTYEYLSSQENLTIAYHTHYKSHEAEEILAQYKKNYQRDILYATTIDGIHKDDLRFKLNGKDASLYASQGQQRSIALAIKLSLLEIVKNEVGEYPILLLDDVLSELDDTRKIKMMDLIDHRIQTFITTTSIMELRHQSIDEANKIYIKNGKKEDILWKKIQK